MTIKPLNYSDNLCLQSRWKIIETSERPLLVYFGLRTPPRKNLFYLSNAVSSLIKKCNGEITYGELSRLYCDDVGIKKELEKFISEGIIVSKTNKRRLVKWGKHTTCIRCVNNDYLIPGLEFNAKGVCAFCLFYDTIKSSRTIQRLTENELKSFAKRSVSDYDAIIGMTGGKDSTFLLWYLAKKLGLRVKAIMWTIPFMSSSAYTNVRSALRHLPNVEFLEVSLPQAETIVLMRAFHRFAGVPCPCFLVPSMLIYPIAVRENIPIVMTGDELCQMKSDYAYLGRYDDRVKGGSDEQSLSYLNGFISFKNLRDIARGEIKRAGLNMVRNPVDRLVEPLETILKTVPAKKLPRIATLSDLGAFYTWKELKGIIEKEMGWKPPKNQKTLLHTSCYIENCKDFCTFQRFLNMELLVFPQSVLEISAAAYCGFITRKEALLELKGRGYWAPPAELKLMQNELSLSDDDIYSPLEIPEAVRIAYSPLLRFG
jgi:hypothetical protein